ncbi:MAG: hypothetical protein JXX28_14545 [Deltaproteobacteria bacterium]|nr:hypothetical protein [Deltaproteobacteria bacterium]
MGAERVLALGEGTSHADRVRRAGQRLLLAVDRVDGDLRHLVREVRPAGFVVGLQEEPAATLAIARELTALTDPARPPLLAAEGLGSWPDEATLGRAEVHAAEQGAALALELLAQGLNLLLGPRGDLGATGLSGDPQRASRQLSDLVEAAAGAGLGLCLTGFPGSTHGEVEVELPVLVGELLRPFRAGLARGAGAVRLAWATYPALDEERPAPLSPRVVSRLLRGGGFDGLVLATVAETRPGRMVAGAQAASVDLLQIPSDGSAVEGLFVSLIHADERGETPGAADSAARVHAWRESHLLGAGPRPPLEVVGCRAHQSLAALIRLRGAP